MRRVVQRVAWMWAVGTGLLAGGRAGADVPLPANMLNPQTAVEAWNIIHLATANVERLLAESRLGEVAVQASLCNPALRTLVTQAPSPELRAQIAELSQRAVLSLTSLVQACTAGSMEDAERTVRAYREALAKLRPMFDVRTAAGAIFFCAMHPDIISQEPLTPCSKCGMKLVSRRIPYSFVYVPPGEPTMVLKAALSAPLSPGQQADVRITLAYRNGVPVVFRDLMVMHTQPIHLLIVDAALRDYHHEHPLPTEFSQTPADYQPGRDGMCGPAPRGSGEYRFSFTPRTAGPYRIFADVVPVSSGIQEFVWTDLPHSSAPREMADKVERLEVEVRGMTFKLAFMGARGGPTRAERTRPMRIEVSGSDGQPMTRLEPFMNAFSHLVGFHEDGTTVVHLHPEGGDIFRSDVHGGPFLNFRFHPPKTGFYRLFCQVQVAGEMIVAPFTISVGE